MSPLPVNVAHKPLFLLAMWVLVSSAANLTWEFAQLPLYTLFNEPDTGKIVRYVLHCTAGDVLIVRWTGIKALQRKRPDGNGARKA